MGNQDTELSLLGVGSKKGLIGDFKGTGLDIPEFTAFVAFVDFVLSMLNSGFQLTLGVEEDLLENPNRRAPPIVLS